MLRIAGGCQEVSNLIPRRGAIPIVKLDAFGVVVTLVLFHNEAARLKKMGVLFLGGLPIAVSGPQKSSVEAYLRALSQHAARQWFAARLERDIPRDEPMPMTVSGIGARLAELGNWRARLLAKPGMKLVNKAMHSTPTLRRFRACGVCHSCLRRLCASRSWVSDRHRWAAESSIRFGHWHCPGDIKCEG